MQYTLECTYLFKLVFSFFSSIYLGVELLGYMVNSMSSFLRNFHTAYHSSYINLHPTNGVQDFLSSTFLPAFLICVSHFLVVMAILTGVKWYLICISLMISGIEHLFICLLAICKSSVGKCLFQSSAIFNWVFVTLQLSYMSCLCILDFNPLNVILFANIFSHSGDCFFVVVIVSFTALLSWTRSHLFIFALGDTSKKKPSV